MSGLMVDPDARALAGLVSQIDRRVKDLERTDMLAHSSIENGSIKAYVNGVLTMLLGQQWDGTNGAVVLNGPVPPAPVQPVVSASASDGLTVKWTGDFALGRFAPMDFARVAVYVLEDPEDLDLHVAPAASITSSLGGTVFVPTPPGVEYHVVLVTWSNSGRPSDPSDAVTGTAFHAPTQAEVMDLIAGQIIDPTLIPSQRVFRQTIEPTVEVYGPFLEHDIWFDTDDDNRMYVWDSVAWVEAGQATDVDTSAALAAAEAAAADAAASFAYAQTRIKTWRQTTAPTYAAGARAGDIWWDDDRVPHIASGTSDPLTWTPLQDALLLEASDAAAQAALDAAEAASDAADAIAAASAAQDDVDAATAAAAAATTAAADAEAAAAAALSTAEDAADDAAAAILAVDAATDAAADATASAAASMSYAQSRNRVFRQNTAPSGSPGGFPLLAQDVWFDADDLNKVYVYDGSSWGPMGLETTTGSAAAASAAQSAAIAAAAADATTKAAAAQAAAITVANTKNRVFRQDAAPANPTGGVNLLTGDTWFDTNDANRIYTWNGSAWVDMAIETVTGAQAKADAAQAAATAVATAAQADADQALADAADAQATADGKVRTFFQTTAPTGMVAGDVGDLWFDTDDGNKMYRWTGSAWEVRQDSGISAAAAAALAAQTTANGRITTFYQTGIPVSLAIGDLWVDTDDGNRLYRAASVGADAITAGEWLDVRDTTISAAASSAAAALTAANNAATAAATAQATADGAIRTYYQSSAPWANGTSGHANDAGDMWFDTDDGQAYRWNDSTKNWDVIEDNSIAAALAAAQNAQTTADGKITAYYAGTAPWANANATHDGDFGDLWYNTSASNEARFWSTSRTWDVVQAAGIAAAQAAAISAAAADATTKAGAAQSAAISAAAADATTKAANAQAAAIAAAATDATTKVNTRNRVFRQNSAPSDPTGGYALLAGDVWFDADDLNRVYTWTGSWTVMGIETETGATSKANAAQAAAISAAAADATTKAGNAQAAAIAAAATDATTKAAAAQAAAIAVANTKNTIFRQNGIPVSLAIGDIWYDTDDGNKVYQAKSVGADAITTGEWEALLVGTSAIAPDSITSSLIAANTIVTGDLSATAIDGMTITGALIQTVVTAARGIKITSTGLTAYNGSGTPTLAIVGATGAISMLGDLTSGSTVTGAVVTGGTLQSEATASRGIKITSGGLTAYNSVGTIVTTLDAATGALTTAGPILTGGSVTGSVLQSEVTAARGIKITSTGLVAYNGSGVATLNIVASTGAITMLGALSSGSTIDGAVITGGTIQSEATASRGVKINSGGLTAYNAGGTPTFTITAATGAVAMLGDLLSGSNVTGATVTGGTLQTIVTAARGIKITTGGLTAYDNSGVAITTLDATTGAFTTAGPVLTGGSVTGSVLQSEATAARGVKINSSGLTAYNGSGVATFNIVAATGAVTMTGSLATGSTIDGATITGGTVQTEATASRGIKMNSSGLTVYNSGGTPTMTITASSGAVSMLGSLLSGSTITGTDITGGTVTGGTIQTVVTAARGIKLTATSLIAYSDGSIGMPAAGTAMLTINGTTGAITMAGALTSGSTIDGAIVTGGTLQSEATAARGVKINSSGLTAYNGSGTPQFTITASTGAVTLAGPITGGGTITGPTFQTSASANTGIKISSAGFIAYNGTSARFTVDASTGDVVLTGALTGGGAITGPTFQTEVTASRGVKITTGGLTAYDNTGVAKFSLVASTGAAAFTGAITGSTLTTSTVTGGTIQSEATAARGVKINSTGLVLYNGSGTAMLTLTAATGAIAAVGPFIAGGEITGATLQTSTTPSFGIKMTGSAFIAYDGGGTPTIQIDGTTGLVSVSGQVTVGGTIDGAIVTGGTLQTEATAARGIKINSAGLTAYNSSGSARFTVDATTGDVVLTGNLTGGGAITGPIVQTSATATTGIKINSTGLFGYGLTNNETFAIDTVTGSVRITGGLVTGGAINGATVTGALVQTEGTAARGVKISTAGVVAYDSVVGSPTLGQATLTIDSATGAVDILGRVTATSMTVLGNGLFLGSSILSGTIKVSNGVPDPTVAPTMGSTWIQYSFIPTYDIVSVTDNAAGTHWIVYSSNGINAESFQWVNKTTFAVDGTTNFSAALYYAVLRTTSGIWALYKSSMTGWRAELLTSSGTGNMVKTGTTTLQLLTQNPDFTLQQKWGSDGTDLFFAAQDSAAPNYEIIVRKVTGFGVGSAGTTSTVENVSFMGLDRLTYVNRGSFDYGSARTQLAMGAYGRNVISGTEQSTSFNLDALGKNGTPDAMWWDGTRFWTFSSVAISKYSTHIAASTHYGRYTWDDVNATGSTHHTAASPASTAYNWPLRKFLTVNGLPPPVTTTGTDDANVVRIYIGTSAGTTWLQTVQPAFGSNQAVYDWPLVTSGTGHYTTNNFGALGITGSFESNALTVGTQGWQLKGDGSINIGTFQLNANGTQVLNKNLADTGWINMNLINGWLNFDSGVSSGGSGRACQYRKINGVVYFRGVCRSGTNGTAIFQMPAGYRPAPTVAYEYAAMALNSGGYSQLLIDATGTPGNLIVSAVTGSATAFTYLAGTTPYIAEA